MSRTSHIFETLQAVRKRLQLERLLKGIAILLGGFLVVSLLSAYVLVQDNFSDDVVFWVRLLVLAGLIIVFVRYVFRPLSAAPSHRQTARFLEEKYPHLQETLSTAVELSEGGDKVHRTIRTLLERDTWTRLQSLSLPRFYHPRETVIAFSALILSVGLFSYLFFAGPEAYHYSMGKLFWDWLDRQSAPLYSISVSPGNVKVGKRADLEITAALNGFTSQNVRILAHYENQPRWEQTSMQGSENNSFKFRFFDIRDRIDYYVESEGIRSPQFTILVAELARVEKLHVVLSFPAYSGLKQVVLEDEGNIRALMGTSAEITITTDRPVKGGKIRLDSGKEVGFHPLEGNRWRARLRVEKDDYYRIHLRDEENFWNPASDEYMIAALEDQPPHVSFRRPGRDQRVTNIEEVFVEVQAEDDYAVRSLQLRYSANGAPEKSMVLEVPRASRTVAGSHTFYLEEFALQPGDFVSYYAVAADAVSQASTDIYFLEVEPYDREYYQSQQSGGGGGGGDSNVALARRQKEIIAATFKLERDKKTASHQEFEENSHTLALVQQRLKGEAQAIAERIERREAAISDPRFRKMVEHLHEAMKHMDPAHGHLNELRPGDALPEEQKSLQQLLRAEALFKEIQVAFGQGQAGGGGGSSAQELADLVDLELDKKKNQYETLQQNRHEDRQQALDEALEKLKELARRQQQLAEKRRRQAMEASGGGASPEQEELIEEAERLARELDRLSRNQPSEQLRDISRELRQAARDMKQAGASGQQNREAQMRAQRAMERLKRAEESLNRHQESQRNQGIEKLKSDAQRVVEQQKNVVDRLGRLQQRSQSGRAGQELIQDLRNLLRDKSQLQEDLYQLEGDLHNSARSLQADQPEASRKLKEAGIDIRDNRIPDKMQEGSDLLSRAGIEPAKRREEGITQDLEEVARKVREASQALTPQGGSRHEEKLQEALSQLGSLVENLESMRQRGLERSARGQGQSEQQEEETKPTGRDSAGQKEDPSGSRSGQQQAGRQEGQGKSQGRSNQDQSSPTEQQGQTPARSSANPSGGPRTASQQAGAGNNTDGIDPRQVQREWQERLGEAEQIRRALRENPELARDLNALVGEMKRLDAERLLSDPQEIARLKAQVIDGFRQLELEIAQALQKQDQKAVRLVNHDEVPPEYRKKVEEYYRTLASKRK
ncbi:MAG: hypothetical protein HY645_12700 [Acidobacteria bacterium]|nr:hypothetical protein [Acidobacteriota bacterium]